MRANPAPTRGAVIALLLVALVWGGAFSLVKDTVVTVAPGNLVTWRFATATVVLLLLRPAALRGLRSAVLVRGATLGTLLGAGFLLHTWGMQSTSVVVSAFVTGTVVVLAPVVARIWLRRRLGPRSAVAIVLATVGLAVITLRGASFGVGELLIALASLFWAIHLVALEVWTKPGEVYQTTLVQLGVVAALAAAWQTATAGRVRLPEQVGPVVALLMLGAVATAGAFTLLTWAQTRTTSTTSAVVLTLEPVFGAATAIALGESLSLPVALGAAAVIAAAILVVRSEPGSGLTPLLALSDGTASVLGGEPAEQGLRRDAPIGLERDGVELDLVHLEQPYPDPAAVPDVRRPEEAGRLGLDHLGLHALGGGTPDREQTVTVVVVEEHDEGLLLPDEEGRPAVA